MRKAVPWLIALSAVALLIAGWQTARDTTLVTVRTADELLREVPHAAGRTIVLAPGVYTIEETLDLSGQNHVNLRGSGWNTTIKKLGPGPAILLEESQFTVIEDLLIGGGEGADVGILYRGYSSSNIIAHCRITGFEESGVRYEGTAEKPMSTNTLRDCHFIDNRGTQLHSLWNNDFYIMGNQFGRWRHVPRVGCHLEHSSAGSYTLNYHWDNEIGLWLGPGSDYNRIENNRLEESRTHGLLIGNPEEPDQWNRYNTITGNTIHTNSKENWRGYAAVLAYDAHDTIFSSNQIFSWYPPETQHREGLVLERGSFDWIVTGNIMRHQSELAIRALPDHGHLIKDNLIDTEPWEAPE
ncbi:MAG: hypothetical protein GF320_20945 [Armatimonadia bacterium]|nr:hypothetical protein [Armatimonadia bacterium]